MVSKKIRKYYNEKAKKYYYNNKEKRIASNKKWILKTKYNYAKKYPKIFKNKAKKYRFKKRMQMIQSYGGKCKCCGETRYEFLSIDHKDNSGYEHRKSFKYLCGNNVINWLKKNNWPKNNFQLLCMNCNWAKGKYGYCPHKKENKIRLSIGQYLMDIAMMVSKRATCPDLSVGCVISSKDGYILSTGYNGVPKKEKHCLIKNNKCLENNINHRVIHAEQNAIASAAKNGIKLENSIAYITSLPCIKCKGILKQSGIKKIYYLDKYKKIVQLKAIEVEKL